MKKCPNCNQVFSDNNLFCLNDGAPLSYVSDSGQSSPFFQTPDSAPTQFIPRQTVSAANASNKIPGWLYLVLGAMAASIVALGAAFYLGRAESEKETAKNDLIVKNDANHTNSENKLSANRADNSSISQTQISNETLKTPPVTAEVVRDLLNRWQQAQNTRNYSAYQTCYGQPFLGIKRTANGGESRMNYGQWLTDRRKMLKNTLSVEIQNLEISTDGDTATAKFTQQFQSVNYNDAGQKILKIKMFPNGAKIIYEEMKYAY